MRLGILLLAHVLWATACATGGPGAAVNAAAPSHGARLITTGYEGAQLFGVGNIKSLAVDLRTV